MWIRIGWAITNQDGSLGVTLDALPTNGKLEIREWEPSTMPETVRPERPDPKRVALDALRAAVGAATAAGLFDDIAARVHPSVINGFVDALRDFSLPETVK